MPLVRHLRRKLRKNSQFYVGTVTSKNATDADTLPFHGIENIGTATRKLPYSHSV